MAEFATSLKSSDFFPCKIIPCGTSRPPEAPEASFPWTEDISRDSRWWVTLASKPLRAEFFLMDGPKPQKMGVLNYPPSGAEPPTPRGPQHRVVFSRNHRWAALQFEQKLYLVDLNADPLQPTEVTVNSPNPFEVQDIDNTGTRWLLLNPKLTRAKDTVSGLWQLKR
jgi:hypothetical protein